ncbi:MAG: protein kinase [Pirellulaceae bacterium]
MKEREVFIEALQKSTGAERSAFLAASCGDDHVLRHAVERLLIEHEKEDGFLLDSPPPGLGSRSDQSPIAEQLGSLIGRYKLLELIGEGGFGAVYMAEQQEPVRRRVALKIIKLGMDTRQVVARFEGERQALALMEHPNIAKVLDAGATETGRLYFVMELVRGVPITEFCDSNTLTTNERLKLFIAVCHAVRHAHQKGIIHRDIKPTNVMVTLHDGQPVPKVIDFGIAKATQQRLTERTVYTGYGQMIGTPQYMSPEQAEMCDQDVDTRTDIYSLGVLLYELLVGTTPFEPDELGNVGYDEMCRIIRETDPPTPSRRLSTLGDAITPVSERRQVRPAVLRKQLQGDLDWIVMKALEKDRTRRYETADALALDTERYLNEEPVLARAPSTLYRFKKYVRKHRAAAAAAACISAALIFGLILATIGLVRADRERRIATSERDRADKHAATAEALARQTRHQLYVSDVNSAYHAWEEGNIDRVRELLDRHVPQPGEEELRGFEWRYLWGEYQRAVTVVTLRHGEIYSVAFSPDSATIASASYDKGVKLWDVATQAELRTLQHENSVCIVFSPDGNILACGSVDHTVRLWDVATGNLIATLPHNQAVASVAFSPDGGALAAGCGGYMAGEIKLWNVATRTEIVTLSGHTACVSAVAFSPDGETLVSGSWDRTVKLWDVEAGVTVKTLQEHTNRVYTVAISPDGRTLASGSSDSAIKLWDMTTHKVIAELERPLGRVDSLAFSPSGATLAVGSQDCRVWLWDLATKKAVPYFTGHSSRVRSLAFSPDGTALASGSFDGTVEIVDVTPFQAERNKEGHTDWLTRLAISSTDGGTLLAVGSGEMVTESRSSEVVLWDVATQDKRSLTVGGAGPVYGVALSPDGQLLATGGMLRQSWTGVVKLWDVPSGKLLRTLEGHTGGVFSLTFSPDGKTLASGDWGRADAETPDSEDWGATIRLWDAATGELRESLPTERFAATSMAFAPRGEILAIGGGTWDEGEIKLWDANSDKAPIALANLSEMVWDVAFSPDGKTLASADGSGGVTLWNVARGRKELAIDAHSHSAFSVAFTPDGKTLASGSLDRTVKLWHVASGDELATLKADAPIWSVAFFPDGNTLAAGGDDKSVTLWHVDAAKEMLRAGSE